MNLFDSFEESDDSNVSKIKPFHTIENSEKARLKWCQDAVAILKKEASERTTEQRFNLYTYRGLDRVEKRSGSRTTDRNYKNLKVSKFKVNHLYDMTETKVSQLTQLKPAVEVVPTNDEYSDKNAAKVNKMLIDHLWYINDISAIEESMQRSKEIFGESYLFILWDKDAGDLHPDYVAARDAGEQLYLLDEEGNQILEEGKPVEIKDEVKTGDVCYEVEVPWRVLLERRLNIKDVEYLFRITIKDTDTLKKMYPNKSLDLKEESNVKAFDCYTAEAKSLENETIVYELYHIPTKFLPKGRYIKLTSSTILEDTKYPFSHGKLPCVRLTALDIPDCLNGVSKYEQVRPIQNMYNNLSTLLAKNIYMCGHAKWMMPRGAAKIEALANDNTIVQYQGPVAPTIVNSNPNPQEAYAYRDKLLQDMGVIYGVSSTSRGTPPAGITAAVALQFLNEQDNQRASTDISKRNTWIKNVAKMTLAVCGDYYQPDDGRMVRIVGSNNAYSIRHFDTANLSKDYDIKVQNSNALPESKAARTQRVIEMMQYNKELLPAARWMDLLDLGDTEKMVSLVTAAIRAADSENEDLLAGRPVGEPEEWEDHIQHWKSHAAIIQGRSFKEEVPEEYKEAFIDHMETTEYAIYEKMKVNPLFQAKVAELSLFPMFYNPEAIPASREQQEAMVQGQANRGEQVTGMIPGTEPDEEV